jgi:hypothetical protein
MKNLTSQLLKVGDTFTIEGVGVGKKGQTIVAGRNIATGRKCKTVKLTVYKVCKVK